MSSEAKKKAQSRKSAGYYDANYIRTERNKARRAAARLKKAKSAGAARRKAAREQRHAEKYARNVERRRDGERAIRTGVVPPAPVTSSEAEIINFSVAAVP